MEKPSVYQTRKIRLTSAILHIGSSVSALNPFEYIEAGNSVYLPNQEALAKALYSRGKLQSYISAIENRETITPLLEDTFSNWKNATDSDGNPIFPSHQVDYKWTEKPITNLRPMIRDGWGQLYIPGSSIKGAIRTAIAHHLLKHNDQKLSDIEKRLREKMDQGKLKAKNQQKTADKSLFMNDLFTNFSLNFQNKDVPVQKSPNTDFMRGIQVSDSQPLVEKKFKTKDGKVKKYNIPVVPEVIVSSYFQDKKAKFRSPLFVEMVHNIRTEFTISIDTEMLSWFRHKAGMQIPFQTIDELLNICKEFAQDQWNLEVEYWQDIGNNYHRQENLDFDLLWDKYYGNGNCPYHLRLGWGSGMLGTTVNGLFPPETRQEIRDTCGIAAPNFAAPKSRRTIKNPHQEIRYVPGWIKLN